LRGRGNSGVSFTTILRPIQGNPGSDQVKAGTKKREISHESKEITTIIAAVGHAKHPLRVRVSAHGDQKNPEKGSARRGMRRMVLEL